MNQKTSKRLRRLASDLGFSLKTAHGKAAYRSIKREYVKSNVFERVASLKTVPAKPVFKV